jgi:hypothetical protein
MNIGYGKIGEGIQECPLCGDDVYIDKYQHTMYCTNHNCVLFSGIELAIFKEPLIQPETKSVGESFKIIAERMKNKKCQNQ